MANKRVFRRQAQNDGIRVASSNRLIKLYMHFDLHRIRVRPSERDGKMKLSQADMSEWMCLCACVRANDWWWQFPKHLVFCYTFASITADRSQSGAKKRNWSSSRPFFLPPAITCACMCTRAYSHSIAHMHAMTASANFVFNARDWIGTHVRDAYGPQRATFDPFAQCAAATRITSIFL